VDTARHQGRVQSENTWKWTWRKKCGTACFTNSWRGREVGVAAQGTAGWIQVDTLGARKLGVI